KVTFGAPASLGRRFANSGTHQVALLEPFQSGVDTSEHDFASAVLLNLLRYRNAIGLITEPDQSQHHHQLKITDRTGARHISSGSMSKYYCDVNCHWRGYSPTDSNETSAGNPTYCSARLVIAARELVR